MSGTDSASLVTSIPHLEYLYTLRCKIDPGVEVGPGPYGMRRHVAIRGGTFTGRYGLNGTILDGGADDMIVVDEVRSRVDTRYMLKTDDGALIYIRTKGGRAGSAEMVAALEAGEPQVREEWPYYLSVVLETGHPKYRWLNERVIVAHADKIDGDICYDAYMVQV